MPKLTFNSLGVTVEAARGSTILEAALEHGVNLYHTCGGNCSCSTCRVVVLSGAESLSPIEVSEAQVLDSFDLDGAVRLGCQAILRGGDVTVDIPEREREPRPNKTPRRSGDSRGTY